MSVAILKNNNYYLWAESCDELSQLSLDDVYSDDFFELLNSQEVSANSDYANEIFLYHWIDVIALSLAVSGAERASIKGRNSLAKSASMLAGCDRAGVRLPGFSRAKVRLLSVLTFLVGFVFSLFLVVPVFCYLRAKNKTGIRVGDSVGSVHLVRSRSAYQKSEWLIKEKGNSAVIVHDPVSYVPEADSFSIYAFLRASAIPRDLVTVFLKVLRDSLILTRDVVSMLGVEGLVVWQNYFARIVHKAVYEVALEHVLTCYPDAELYSGDKDDRFAVMQTRVVKFSGRTLVCIPHGLEYGYRFPSGVCGTCFYTYSQESCDVLSGLYGKGAFVYDQDVAFKMLDPASGNDVPGAQGNIQCCYFTEPRDPEVNLEIISSLISSGLDFYVKLHPLEEEGYYRAHFPDLRILDDYNQAISASCCLARKSTVLLESAARGNKSIAVLINSKDRMYVNHVFPSLSSNKIIHVENLSQISSLVLI